MKIITIAAQKGGAGKTTLAVNLAVAAQAGGIKTALIDLDPQESATAWSERRTAELPHVEPLSARRLSPWINAAEAEGFALAIIDTPPAAGAEAAEAVQRSRSEEHTSELQSLMRISYAVFCLKKKIAQIKHSN